MLSICSWLLILPASTYAGSPPTQLNSTKTRSTTPSSVGTICQSLRTMYAVISTSVYSVVIPAEAGIQRLSDRNATGSPPSRGRQKYSRHRGPVRVRRTAPLLSVCCLAVLPAATLLHQPPFVILSNAKDLLFKTTADPSFHSG